MVDDKEKFDDKCNKCGTWSVDNDKDYYLVKDDEDDEDDEYFDESEDPVNPDETNYWCQNCGDYTTKVNLYDTDHLNEVTFDNVVSDLEGLKKSISGLIRSFSLSDIDMDNETKLNLLAMTSDSLKMISDEMDKLLRIQVENGKELLSNEAIENLVNDIIKEEIK
tara:strand:+ start:754 stop:1248 length:495 start_codon:yes stop_codon:yes gene_type:complete